MQVAGKVAVITGAARGVGRATGLALARLGCNVVINYHRSRERAERTVRDLEARGVRALAIQGDVRQDEDCRALMATAHQEFGHLDILVNNAGTTVFIPHGELEKVEERHWDDLFATNVRGVFQCCRAVKPWMEKSGGGEIVNLSSIAGIRGTGSSVPYCASKAAVITLTLSLARVFGPRIRVNAVAPGFIAGEWLQEGLGEGYEEARKARADAAVLKKVCTPEDVAAAIVSIITGSDLVTGQNLVCDGGTLLGG
ncbi:MAG: SDR family oxidoreductase [Opitutaceae bacterium]